MGSMWICSAFSVSWGAGIAVMRTKSVAWSWSKRRGSTAAKKVVGATAPVTLVPSALVMVTDLPSKLAIVPRTNSGGGAGASAAKAGPASSVAEMISVRSLMGVPPGRAMVQSTRIAPRRASIREVVYDVSRTEAPASARHRVQHDFDTPVARLVLVVAGGNTQMGLAETLGGDAAGRNAFVDQRVGDQPGALLRHREIALRRAGGVGVAVHRDADMAVAAQQGAQRLKHVVAGDAAIRCEEKAVLDHDVDVVAAPRRDDAAGGNMGAQNHLEGLQLGLHARQGERTGE